MSDPEVREANADITVDVDDPAGASSSSLLSHHQKRPASPSSSSSKKGFARVAHRTLIIQKVPKSVRDSLGERYFEPDVVSIGPYHRAKPHLVEMEDVKEALVHEFCPFAMKYDEAVSMIHGKLSPILQDARSSYAEKFETIKDDEFIKMMVIDGCFLLAVMAILTREYPEKLQHRSWTHGRMLRIMKDILLFENQIPWAVMLKLITLCAGIRVDVDEFVSRVLDYFDIHTQGRHRPDTAWDNLNPSPVHLLDLVHQRHLGLAGFEQYSVGDAVKYCDYARPFAHFTSAVELAEAGVHLHGSSTCRVKDVRVEPLLRVVAIMLGLRIGNLVLPPLSLSWLPRCWLINMVALECVTDRSDRSGVSSYLAILGSLVRAERDVEELRSKRILFSTMSDRQTVEFFNVLLDPLPRQKLYLDTLKDIVQLRSTRNFMSGIHGIYYRNRSIIVAVVPLLIAILGIALTNSIKHK